MRLIQPQHLVFVLVSLCLSVCVSLALCLCLCLSLCVSLSISLSLCLCLSVPRLLLSLHLPPSFSFFLTLHLRLFLSGQRILALTCNVVLCRTTGAKEPPLCPDPALTALHTFVTISPFYCISSEMTVVGRALSHPHTLFFSNQLWHTFFLPCLCLSASVFQSTVGIIIQTHLCHLCTLN